MPDSVKKFGSRIFTLCWRGVEYFLVHIQIRVMTKARLHEFCFFTTILILDCNHSEVKKTSNGNKRLRNSFARIIWFDQIPELIKFFFLKVEEISFPLCSFFNNKQEIFKINNKLRINKIQKGVQMQTNIFHFTVNLEVNFLVKSRLKYTCR